MIIFEKSGIVVPGQDKTNISLSFSVPNKIKKLIIDYEYTTKMLADKATAYALHEKSIETYHD